MAHPEQIAYFDRISEIFRSEFANAGNVLEVGSQNINGTVRDFFINNINYLGLDIGSGDGVDLVIPGELVELPDGWADIAISTECFEHARNWKDILLNMIRITKPEGLIILTFAGKGRATHGTLDSDVFSSPFTTTYYLNLGPDDLAKEVAIGRYFQRHGFEVNSKACDTYFWGIRNSDSVFSEKPDWEMLEKRLTRAQGQLSQAVNTYTELKLKLEKSESIQRQLKADLLEAQQRLQIALNQAETNKAARDGALQEAEAARLSATHALGQRDQAYRKADELAKQFSETQAQLSDERHQAAVKLQTAEQSRRNAEKDLEHAIQALTAAEQAASTARQEAEIARQQSQENWQKTMEIVNSTIWRGTRPIRRIKDVIRRRRKSDHETTLPFDPPETNMESLPGDGHTIQKSSRYSLADKTNWLNRTFEENWKELRDLNNQARPSNATRPTDTTAIIIDWKCPEADKDSGSHRMNAIIEIMLDLGISVNFISHASEQDLKYQENLKKLGISVFMGPNEAAEHLSTTGHDYQYVFMARPDTSEAFLPLVHLFCPAAIIIYDTVDLHYLRMRRALPLLPNDAKHERDALIKATDNYYAKELIISSAADKVVVVSDAERQLLLKEKPSLNVVTIPNIHSVLDNTNSFDEREGLLFIGGFDHQPNKDAMIFFCSDIFPRIIDQLGPINLTIAGSNMPEEIFALRSDCVQPIGYVEDLDPILSKARIFVAPLRYGAGMKGKVGLSMAHGLPVVGTQIAAEGFGFTNGREMEIADDPRQFADYTVKLYRDRDQWKSLANEGKRFIDANYSPNTIKSRLANLFERESAAKELDS
ncbi:MAG: glycosyltransferase [Cyanobacteriota bacterium]|jgi:glycosyltransferase involved in cell wall biosynthesis/SAM-dependent methyltransferase